MLRGSQVRAHLVTRKAMQVEVSCQAERASWPPLMLSASYIAVWQFQAQQSASEFAQSKPVPLN